MWDSKTFCIPEAKGLIKVLFVVSREFLLKNPFLLRNFPDGNYL